MSRITDSAQHDCNSIESAVQPQIKQNKSLIFYIFAEQLIDLHPPEKISVPYTLVDRLYLYWEPPRNFKMHDPTNETHTIAVDKEGNLVLTPKKPGVAGKGPGVTLGVLTLNTTAAPVINGSDSAKPQQNGTTNSNTTNTDKDSGKAQGTGVDKTNQNNTKANNNTANSDSKDSGPETSKDGKANVTESVKDNVNVSASSNQTDTKVDSSTPSVKSSADSTTEKPPVATSTASPSDLSKVGNKSILYLLEDFYWQKRVPFHFAVLGHYIVSYKKDTDCKYTLTELPHNKTNKVVCAPSEDSDQHGGTIQSDQSLCCALSG